MGYGRLHADTDAWFQRRLKLLTSGNRKRPVLFFCLMNCWMSWNAAKRAIEWGYRLIVWFPDGTDAWRAAGLALEEAEPVPR